MPGYCCWRRRREEGGGRTQEGGGRKEEAGGRLIKDLREEVLNLFARTT